MKTHEPRERRSSRGLGVEGRRTDATGRSEEEAMSRARECWDAVVIGSGLGGLSVAAYLCAAGRRTLVLEAHHVAGGNSQVFRRTIRGREYEFDVGIHYIGECGRDGMITNMLHGLGLAERVVFRPLDADRYSTLVFPDLSFEVPVGWDRYRKRLLETFPDEADGLGRVVDVMRQLSAEGRRLMRGEIGFDGIATQAPTFVQWGLRPVTEFFAEHQISERAVAVLLGEQATYAVRPSETPVVLAAGIADHFLRGAFYPEGGGQVLAGRLIQAIRAYGGEVRTRVPVKRVRIEAGRVAGVVAGKRDEEIDAPVVVSNADLKRTICQLVGEEHFSPRAVEQVHGYRMAFPLFGVYLGLDVDLAAEGFPNSNHFIWDDYDVEAVYDRLEAGEIPADALTYVTVASLKDPTNPHLAPSGHTNLQIMTLAPREFDVWNVHESPTELGRNRYHRDPEYRRRKREIADRLVANAERVLPGIRDHIDWQEAATPVTQERFTRSTGGTSYGIEFSIQQAGPLRMGPRTDVPGLFLCGASTPTGPGIAGVMRSGLIAAGEVLESDLLGAVLGGEILGDRDALPPLADDWDPLRESH
jgi:phytoene dehydrogenase-like protein